MMNNPNQDRYIKSNNSGGFRPPFDRQIRKPNDRSTDRSIDRSTDRSIDRTTDRSIDRSTDRSIDRSTDRSTDRSIDGNGDMVERSKGKSNWTQELIGYIYRTVDVSQFKYEMLEYESELSRFIQTTYYVSPNFNGKNCFLVFTKIGSKYHSFIVDRRQLSYSLDKVRFENVEIINCNVEVDSTIYKGSIFDGIYIRRGNEHQFIITDVYHFKGSDYTGVRLDMKLFEIDNYIESISDQIVSKKDRINSRIDLNLTVNKIYTLDQIENVIQIISQYSDKQVRGLCFYPEKSGTKSIFMFPNQQRDQKNSMGEYVGEIYDGSRTNVQHNEQNKLQYDNKVQPFYSKQLDAQPKNNILKKSLNSGGNLGISMDSETRKTKGITKRIYMAKTDNPIYAILEMKATDTVDVYRLYCVDMIKTDGVTKLKKCQMDIAYIPNIERSEWCRSIINDSVNKSCFVRCVWRENKKKWEPLELNKSVRLPSLIEDIRKDLVEMELSDSDSDVE